jgi:hypothetical protein
MVDSSEIIIAHPDEKNILQLDLKSLAGMENITRSMLAGQDGAEAYAYKGIDKVAALRPSNKSSGVSPQLKMPMCSSPVRFPCAKLSF